MKVCRKCKELKPLSEFHKNRRNPDGYQKECKACVKQYKEDNKERFAARHRKHSQIPEVRARRAEYSKVYNAAYYPEHAEERCRHEKEMRDSRRTEFIELYGGKCALCEASEPEFLTLSHVAPIPAEDKKGHDFYYRDAVRSGVPDFSKYRILCWNHALALSHPRRPYEELSYQGKYVRNLIDAVIAGYGGRCSCCGETTREFLQLDHVNGGGGVHIRRGGSSVHYRDARNRDFPPEYQVLCANCNHSKHLGGVCLHQRDDLLARLSALSLSASNLQAAT